MGEGSRRAGGAARDEQGRRDWLGSEGKAWDGRKTKKLSPSMAFAGKRRRKTKKARGNDQTVMDSIKGIHYGFENDEIYLVVVVVDAETRRFGRKSPPKNSQKT